MKTEFEEVVLRSTPPTEEVGTWQLGSTPPPEKLMLFLHPLASEGERPPSTRDPKLCFWSMKT